MLGIVNQYPDLIYLAIIMAVYLLFDFKTAMAELKKDMVALMLSLEKDAKDKVAIKGQELMQRCIVLTLEKLVPKLPVWIRPLMTEKMVTWLAQKLYDYAIDLMDDGKLNSSC